MYVKKYLDEEAIDGMRLNLAAQERKLSPEPVCDFCGDPKPLFVYAAWKMSTGEMRDCWRWCACGDCSHAVDMESWEVIEAKVLHRLHGLLPVSKGSPLILSAVRLAIEEFHRYAQKTL